jgi:radical SAM superfamily enzyme YgiQ (UPF0313 family)
VSPVDRRGAAGISAAVIFPNKREIACASLGFLKAYDVLRSKVSIADLSYLPTGVHDHIVSPKQGLLLGEMSHLEIGRFDIVGFSISYENDYVHVPELITRAGLEPMAEDRTSTFPVVMAGGFTMSTNPLPVADFLDVAVVGEIEPVAEALVGTVREAKLRGAGKGEIEEMLARVPGVYVPARGERPVKRVWSAAETIAPEPVLPPGSHFGDMFLVETGRGCGRGCHFCAARSVYRPVRTRGAAEIIEIAERAPKVGLVGTAVGDHPDLEHVLTEITSSGRRVGIASLRPDQITPAIAGLLVKGGVKTMAIAPEAGTETLRARIGKPIKDAVVRDAVRMLAEAGIRNVKLYFMIGLPGETDKDVKQLVRLVAKLAEIRGRARLTVAAGPFVPKPQTAFQWAPFCDRETLRKRVVLLREVSRLKGCALRLQSIGEAWVEAVLSRGGRSLSGPLVQAAGKEASLRGILRRIPTIDPTRELDAEKPLPWDFIDVGLDRKGLRRKYLEAKAR